MNCPYVKIRVLAIVCVSPEGLGLAGKECHDSLIFFVPHKMFQVKISGNHDIMIPRGLINS
jgi:hypothetical protein